MTRASRTARTVVRMDTLPTAPEVRCERCGVIVVPAAPGAEPDGHAVVRAVHSHYLTAGHLSPPRRAQDLAVAG